MRKFFSLGVEVLVDELARLDARVKDTLAKDMNSLRTMSPEELNKKYKEYFELKKLYSSKLFSDELSRIKIDDFSKYLNTLSQFDMLLVMIRNGFDFSSIESKMVKIIKGVNEILK